MNALQDLTGMEPSVSVVLEGRSSTKIKISVNAPKIPGGMAMAVRLLNSVKMVNNGMCLSLCVNVLIQVFGMELIV